MVHRQYTLLYADFPYYDIGVFSQLSKMSFSLLVIFLFFQLLLQVSCQDDPVKDNFTLVATKGPISQAFGGRKETIEALLDHMGYIERAIFAATKEANKDPNEESKKLDGQEPPTSCNHRNDGWNDDLIRYFGNRNWSSPKLNLNCVSDVYGAGAKDGVPILGSDQEGLTKKEAYDIVVEHSKTVNELAPLAVKNAGLENDPHWKKAKHVFPERAFEYKYDDDTQQCTYDYAAFVKRNNQWYVAERITNAVSNLTRQNGERRYLFEYIAASGDTLEVTALKDGNQSTGSTIQLISSGFVTASGFGRISPNNNPAVQSAISEGEHSTQQAADATTPSNIAILALPLMMNVVPVALIAETNNLGMLLYTLLTDVLTAVPLAIKGIEVLIVGKKDRYSIVTRFTGGNLDEDVPNDKGGEMWVAKCSSSKKFRARGIAFLTIAITFMIVGVILEIVARKYKKRKSKQKIPDTNPLQSGQTAAASSSVQFHNDHFNLIPGQNDFTYSNQNIDEEIGASTSVGLEHPAAVVLAMAQGRDRNANDEGHWWRRNRRRDQNENTLRGYSAYPQLPEYDEERAEQTKND